MLPAEIRHSSPTTLRGNLIKIRAKDVRDARQVTLQLAKAAGLVAGAAVMAVEKGIAMAVVPGAGSGFQVLGLIVGALYGLFFSWAILSSINE